jgi:inosine-uridine nucleoside N-ribohydrolase
MSIFENILVKTGNAIMKLRRALIIIIVMALVSAIVYFVLKNRQGFRKPSFSVIIDSDTGNGISDIFAISRALADQGFKLIGLTSAQWNQNPLGISETVYFSQALNDSLLIHFNKESIPHFSGGETMIGYGSDLLVTPSEASEFIVKKANEASLSDKLNIITFGSLTNLATAILTDSSIIPKLRVYSLAMRYNPATKVWDKNELNARNDIDALDLILNTKNLEIHIMPVSTSREFFIGEEEIIENLKDKGEPWDFIFNRYLDKFAGENEYMIPEAALIEAMKGSNYAKEELVNSPPENTKRQIYVYTSVNKEFMKIDFWKVIKKSMSGN